MRQTENDMKKSRYNQGHGHGHGGGGGGGGGHYDLKGR
jgi:hypothetical protein